MWPAAYCSRPDGIATVPPCGTLRASMIRSPGSSRRSISHSTSTKSRATLDPDRRLAQREARLRVVGDVLADGERGRRGRRGRVADVHDALGAFEHEIVDQR